MTLWTTTKKVNRPSGGAEVMPERSPGAAEREVESKLHQSLIRDFDEEVLSDPDRDQVRERVGRAARVVATEQYPGLVGDAKEVAISHVVDEVTGLGPIEPLLRDPSISEVMVNAPDEIYFEREGKIFKSDLVFHDHAHVRLIIDRIVGRVGRHVDDASPMVDARLPDGSRVNIVIPPLVPKSAVITIRKFRAERHTMQDLVKLGSLSAEMALFMEACVRAKLNVLISGGTGSGKTTFLNSLSEFMSDRERLVTIEDPIELKLHQAHVIQLEARHNSTENTGEVSQRDLVRNALRMRPDRIIVGEVRGPEAFDMMQAMNTGHEGSLTTVHANSPRDAMARVENMILMAGFEMPVRVIREQMAAALHVVVQLSRMMDGTRKVVQVSEVSGMEGTVVTLQEIFRYRQTGIDQDGKLIGRPQASGIRPKFADRFADFGVTLPPGIFDTDRWV